MMIMECEYNGYKPIMIRISREIKQELCEGVIETLWNLPVKVENNVPKTFIGIECGPRENIKSAD